MSEQLIRNVPLPRPCATSAQLRDCAEVGMELWLKAQRCKNINSAGKQNLYGPVLSFCFVLLTDKTSPVPRNTFHITEEDMFFPTSQEG